MRVGLNMMFVAPGVAGGGGVYARKLLAALSALPGPDDYVCYTRAGVDLSTGTVPRCHQVRAPVSSTSTYWRAAWEYGRLPALARTDRLDVFHGLGTLSPSVHGVPFVLTVHDLLHLHFPGSLSLGHRLFMTFALPRLARRADRVIVPSDATRRDVLTHLGVRPDRIRLIPYGPGNDFSPVTDPAAVGGTLARCGLSPPYVITVARGYAHKNLDGLLRAFARVRAGGFSDVRLALVGERYRSGDAVDRLVRQLGLADAVVCTGRVSDDDLRALYSAAQAFAFPSLFEGLGLPPLEAMACGVPVVASDASAIPECIGDAGVLADARDPERFATALARVLGDAALRDDLRRRGLERAARFSWKACAEQTLAVYRELV